MVSTIEELKIVIQISFFLVKNSLTKCFIDVQVVKVKQFFFLKFCVKI